MKIYYKFVLISLVLLWNCSKPPCSNLDTNCGLGSYVIISALENIRYAGKISFLPIGGAYQAEQFVKLYSDKPTEIRYTTDGSTPTCSSSLYTSPIFVSTSNTTIQAISCTSGKAYGQLVSQNYTFTRSVSAMSGLTFWYSAQSLDLADGAPISSWKDLSPNGNNLTSGGTYLENSLRSPTFKINAQNGQPSVQFKNANKQFFMIQNMKGLTNTNSFAFVFLLKKSVNSINGEFLLHAGQPSVLAGNRIIAFSSSNQIALGSTTNTSPIFATTSASPISTLQLGNFYASSINVTSLSSISISFAGGASQNYTISQGFNAGELLVLGNSFFYNSTDIQSLEGEILEAFYFNRSLVQTDFVPLCFYVNEKYALGLTCN